MTARAPRRGPPSRPPGPAANAGRLAACTSPPRAAPRARCRSRGRARSWRRSSMCPPAGARRRLDGLAGRALRRRLPRGPAARVDDDLAGLARLDLLVRLLEVLERDLVREQRPEVDDAAVEQAAVLV